MFDFLTGTLSRYLARIYFINFIGLLSLLLGVVFLFDTIELLRRAAKVPDTPVSIILEMSLMKLPEMANVIAPFAVLFAALYTFWQLTKRSELVVLRTAGISVWQFLSPVIVTAVATGLIMVTLINPLSSVFFAQYNNFERKYLSRNDDGESVIAVFEQGLWLRQETQDGYAVLHAETVDPDWRLQEVVLFFFDKNNRFEKRMDAPGARLSNGKWNLNTVTVNAETERVKRLPSVEIPTSLTSKDIEESFSSPQSMGFWMMPSFIRTLESTGFDSTRVRIHFQSLLAQPFLYAAMILLAACVALRPQRQGQSFTFVLIGVLTGFSVFLLSNFLQALGASHQLPVFLAAWSPAFIAMLVGTSVLLTLEDG